MPVRRDPLTPNQHAELREAFFQQFWRLYNDALSLKAIDDRDLRDTPDAAWLAALRVATDRFVRERESDRRPATRDRLLVEDRLRLHGGFKS
jgi:hypothetical protein